MDTPLKFWIAFHLGVLAVLAIDLCRKTRVVSLREAGVWSAVWVFLSLAFNALIWKWKGGESGLEFLTGYLVEYSLSVDNILVFVLILSYFRVPPEYQHRVLFWGVLGAIVLRGLMIAAGVVLVHRFAWILYLFGAFLVVTAIRMGFHRDASGDLGNNPVLRGCRRLLPVTQEYAGSRFLLRRDGRWMLTPLALVLVFVDLIDVVFAVDSIPAIFAITRDSFIIYTSNICAILGLRSLYFLLAGVIEKFVYLKKGLALVLGFIGAKMLLADWISISTAASLAAVAAILLASVALSIRASRRGKGAAGDVG